MPEIEPQARSRPQPTVETAFLVFDCESIPDGKLLNRVKYAGEGLSPEQAIEKARTEALAATENRSDFIPYTFQLPVAVCVVRVGADFQLQTLVNLDAPLFRPREIVKKFWLGQTFYGKSKLVTFNGRAFDLPLLELAAFRFGFSAGRHFQSGRNRFNGDLDLMDWLNNYGASRMVGGLDLLAKMLGKPGKMEVSGDQVYAMYQAGKQQEINDYCMFDTLDTYFVFLRTRVLTGDITIDQEQEIVEKARKTLEQQIRETPALRTYLDRWTVVNDFEP